MEETLNSALKAAGEVLLKHFNMPGEARIKESQSSVVTIADMESDSLIVKMIREKFPKHNIISEEGGYLNNYSEFTWVIDPLDGTSNFAAGLPWFGVLITLFHNEEPFLGGAYLPLNDTLYFAEKGKGAYRNGNIFTMKNNKELIESLVTFSVDYTSDEVFLNRCIEIYKNIVKGARNIRSTNSLVDFIYTAEGKFGGCINLFTRIWDISALGLIISEAGGKMVDINGAEIEFILDKDVTERNFSVVAGSERIVNRLTSMLI
jgi:myo-inositol-1(or 4)-monophosphatase